MKLALFIAKRYLFSQKSHNVINVISVISMLAVGIGALALIVVMSAFNGLEELVESLYSTFDPEISIAVEEGKTFDHATFPENKIRAIEGVAFYTQVIEETALLRFGDEQCIARVKGVEDDFLAMSDLETMKTEGRIALTDRGMDFTVLGYGISYNLSVYPEYSADPITMYAARRNATFNITKPDSSFRKLPIVPSGVFSINPDFDEKYALVPLRFARSLFDYSTEVTGVEIGLSPGADADAVADQIRAVLGAEFIVKTRYQLNEIIYKTNETEKWVAFLIVSFILVIATFNIIGSLVMLIIEKKKDIYTLRTMGATRGLVKAIFLTEGLMISLLGGLGGLLLGSILVWAQQEFGFVPLRGVIVDYYPVKLMWTDFSAILITVVVLGFVAAWFPVQVVVNRSWERVVQRM